MKNPLAYSASQKGAMTNFQSNLCVSAGAGSGKTTVLVERFLHAVSERKIGVERILAITFTDKAANEMKKRLVHAASSKSLAQFRRELENSYIGTIHSFCSRILKENPVESGVDPDFRVLADAEADILSGKILDGLFEEQADNMIWLDFLSEAGESAIRSALIALYEAYRSSGGDEVLLSIRNHEEGRRESKRKLLGALKDLGSRLSKKELSETELKMKEASACIEEMLNAKETDFEGITNLWEQKKRFFRGGANKDYACAVHNAAEEYVQWELMRLYAPVKKEFVRIFSVFKERYEAEKRRLAAYDFEDLLFYTYKLFSGTSPEKKVVIERYREKFQSILVDEYQDTSPLQAKIIGCLKSENNLFVVGDVQQAIYGFRGADPDVFLRMQKELKTIPLVENYRTRPEILHFINRLFESVFSSATFQALVPKRSFKTKKDHTVEWLCVVRDAKLGISAEKARVLEAQKIASRIRTLVDSSYAIEDKMGERPIRYSDIAILMSATTNIYLYEKELHDAGIPSYSLKSRGFFEKPEIKDALNLLSLLEGRNADIALAGVLRSPFVGLSDDALYWLANSVKKDDTRGALLNALYNWKQIASIVAEDKAKLERFEILYHRLRQVRDRLTISEILNEAFQETSYEAKILTQPDGYQKMANIRKLLQIAETAESDGMAGTDEFVCHVQRLSEREDTEPQAKIRAEAENVVTLSTIHSAKGLEFPCVIVADMGNKGNSESGRLIFTSNETGLGIKSYKSDLPLSDDGRSLRDYAYSRCEETWFAKENAERERLLYVALTRAKELLILSGSIEAPKDKDDEKVKKNSSWMEKISKSVDMKTENIFVWNAAKAVYADEGVVRFSEDPGIRRALTKRRLDVSDTKGWKGGWEKVPWTELSERLKPVERFYEEIRDATVTELTAVASEKQRTPVSDQEPVKMLEEDEILAPRNEFGTIFHRIMELTAHRRGTKPDKTFLEEALKPLAQSQADELKDAVERFWSGPLGAQIKKSKKVYPELPFIYKTKKGILKGQIDLLYAQPNGEWVILDYKTNQVDAAGLPALSAFYRMQLALYAYIFGKLYGTFPKKGILYFSSINETVSFDYDDTFFDGFEKTVEELYSHLS